MAGFVPCPEVGEFVIKQILAGQDVFNVLHIKKIGGWTAATLTNMAVALMSAWFTNMSPIQAGELLYQGITGRDLSTAMGAVVDVPWTPGQHGAAGGGAEPGNVALAVGHKTGLAGRSARGRTFLGGISEDWANQGKITDGQRVVIQTAFDNLGAAIEAAGGKFGVLSRYSGYTQTPPKYKKVPIARAEGIFNEIISNVADTFVDSMRKRLPGRGA